MQELNDPKNIESGLNEVSSKGWPLPGREDEYNPDFVQEIVYILVELRSLSARAAGISAPSIDRAPESFLSVSDVSAFVKKRHEATLFRNDLGTTCDRISSLDWDASEKLWEYVELHGLYGAWVPSGDHWFRVVRSLEQRPFVEITKQYPV
jgi:hypothetical protein